MGADSSAARPQVAAGLCGSHGLPLPNRREGDLCANDSFLPHPPLLLGILRRAGSGGRGRNTVQLVVHFQPKIPTLGPQPTRRTSSEISCNLHACGFRLVLFSRNPGEVVQRRWASRRFLVIVDAWMEVVMDGVMDFATFLAR